MITLLEAEQRLVKFMSEKRIAYNRKVGSHATLYSGADADEPDFMKD